MRKPHSFLVGGAVGLRTRIHASKIEWFLAPPAQRREVNRIQREQGALEHGLVKESVTRDPFDLQGRHKLRAGHVFHLLRKIFENVSIGGEASNPRIGLQQANAGRVLQPSFEVLHVLFSDSRLLRKPYKLGTENGRLEFAHAVIESYNAVVKKVSHAGATGVDVALDLLHVLQVVADHCSTFTG